MLRSKIYILPTKIDNSEEYNVIVAIISEGSRMQLTVKPPVLKIIKQYDTLVVEVDSAATETDIIALKSQC